MLHHAALPPIRVAIRVLTILLSALLLGLVFFVPLPYSVVFLGYYQLLSLLLFVLIGATTVAVFWERAWLRLHSSLLALAIGILLLYGSFIIWPACESGLAWFAGNPNKADEFADYHLWYIHALPMDHTLSDYMAVLLMIGTLLAAWYILLPLGVLLILSLAGEWRGLRRRTRWATLGVSVLAIAVPLLTWRASHQFWLWFID